MMIRHARSLFLTLGLCSAATPLLGATPQAAAAPTTEAGEAVVLHFGEERATWAEFGSWLVRNAGSRHVEDVTRDILVAEALAAAGLSVTEADARAVVDAEVERRIELAFDGDRDAWLAELERTGNSELSFFASRTAETLGELQIDRLVLSRRRTDEAGLKDAWERLYGPGGRQPELRALFLKLEDPLFPEGTDEFGKEMLRDAKRRQVERRCGEFLRRARSGQDFGEILRAESQHEASRELDGYLPEPYAITDWPAELADALRTAKVGDFVGPILTPEGYWGFEVAAIEETPFDEVRDDIVTHLREAPATSVEIRALVADLYAGVTPRELPELWTDPAQGIERMDRPVYALGDRAITRREVATWLTARRGVAEAPFFVQTLLVEQAAAAANIEVTPLQVEQRLEADIAARVEVEHDGNRAAWLHALNARGRTEEEWKLEHSPRTHHVLLVESLLLSEREVTDADVRALWEDRFGPGGVSPRIRLILRRPTPPPAGVQFTPEQRTEYLTQQELEITTLLNELRGRLANGEDFATLAKRYSQDPLTKDRGGLQPHRFRYDAWGGGVREKLEALEIGEVSQVIEYGADYLVFENSGVTNVPYEEVAQSLRQELETRRPSSIDVARYQSRLLGAHTVRPEAALFTPYLSGAGR